MSFRGSVRALLGLTSGNLDPPDLVSFYNAAVITTARHYGLTERTFDGDDWHQVPARFLAVSGAFRLERSGE